DTETIDVDVARGHPFAEAGFFFVDLQYVAIGQDKRVALGHSDRFGQARVDDEVPVLAMDRHEVLGLENALDDFELLAAGVTADVNVRDAVVENVGAEAEEVVDVAIDGGFVARNGRGGEYNGVALLDLDVAVRTVGHAGEGARGLALAPGGDDDELAVRGVPHLFDADDDAVGGVEV